MATSLRVFLLGIFFLGINQGIMTSTFNNYVHDIFLFDAGERGFLEFPREFPGFALIAVTIALSAFPMRIWGVLVGILSMLGVFGLGYAATGTAMLVVWTFLWSMADHLFMPIESSMGLLMAREGAQGRRLGQISGMRNLSMICGSFLVWTLMGRIADLSYATLYLIAAIAAACASLAFSRMHVPEDESRANRAFVVRKRYLLFYWLNILFGARKQIFLTFAPWLLVSQFHTAAETMALLIMIAATLGVVFRQAFGVLVDRLGERFMLAADAFVMLAICLGFAFSRQVYLLYGLYILDNLMFATRIARTTYLNKIAVDKKDITATISLGITLDHLVSMSVPALGGMLWLQCGYQCVFLVACAVAFLNLLAACSIRTHSKPQQIGDL